jgi:hypothetical protein
MHRQQEIAQHADREAVARVHADSGLYVGQHALDFDFELGSEAVQRRIQPRGDPAIGPEELLAERREHRAPAARHRDQRRPEDATAAAHQLPGVAVGHAQLLRRARELSRFVHRGEQLDELMQGSAHGVEPLHEPLRLDRHLEHIVSRFFFWIERRTHI